MEDNIPDPNSYDIEESDMDKELEERVRMCDALSQNGFSGVLILSRNRIGELDDVHLSIIDYIKNNDVDSPQEIVDSLTFDGDTLYSAIDTLGKLNIIGKEDGVRLLHDNVIIVMDTGSWPSS